MRKSKGVSQNRLAREEKWGGEGEDSTWPTRMADRRSGKKGFTAILSVPSSSFS